MVTMITASPRRRGGRGRPEEAGETGRTKTENTAMDDAEHANVTSSVERGKIKIHKSL